MPPTLSSSDSVGVATGSARRRRWPSPSALASSNSTAPKGWRARFGDGPPSAVAVEIDESRGVAAIATLRCARDGNALAALHCAVVAAPAAADGRDGAVAG